MWEIIVFILIIFFTSIGVGSLGIINIPFAKKFQNYNITESFSCGIFLGVALLLLLKEGSKVSNYRTYFYIVFGLTFLGFLFLEHLLENQLHFRQNKLNKKIKVVGGNKLSYEEQISNAKIKIKSRSLVFYFLWVSIIVHSFFAGLALGSSIDKKIVWTLFAGIIIHKSAISYALSTKMKHNKFSFLKILLFLVLFSLSTPIGIIAGYFFRDIPNESLAAIYALSAGTFLYLGTLHGLYNSVLIKTCCDLKYFLLVLLGFSIIIIVVYV